LDGEQSGAAHTGLAPIGERGRRNGMSRKKIIWLSMIPLVFAACSRAPQDSAGLEKQKVVLAVGGKTGIAYLPLTLAEQLGYFKEEGLEVEIQDLQGGSKALQAMVGGSADVVIGYFDHTVQMQAINKDITGITLLGRYPGFVLGVRTDLAGQVENVGQLKDMKVGATAPGSSTHFFINFLMSRQGFKPSDVSVVGIGASPAAIAAVEQKQVDALVNLDPMITALDIRGLIKILVDTRTEKGTMETYGGPYPGSSLYTTRDFIERYPRTAQALVNAIVKGLRWIRGKTAEEIALQVPESYFAGSREIYLKALASSLDLFSPDGRFSEEGAKKAAEVLAMFDDSVARANIDLSKTFTNRFVDQALVSAH
jgi:NitT/TauT family transport system substrate-binding protein